MYVCMYVCMYITFLFFLLQTFSLFLFETANFLLTDLEKISNYLKLSEII